jgi:hypothetical protein
MDRVEEIHEESNLQSNIYSSPSYYNDELQNMNQQQYLLRPITGGNRRLYEMQNTQQNNFYSSAMQLQNNQTTDFDIYQQMNQEQQRQQQMYNIQKTNYQRQRNNNNNFNVQCTPTSSSSMQRVSSNNNNNKQFVVRRPFEPVSDQRNFQMLGNYQQNLQTLTNEMTQTNRLNRFVKSKTISSFNNNS